jgi:transcriptional regulator with XRE-family HTH domain
MSVLKYERMKMGLSQRQLAKRAHVSKSTIHLFENRHDGYKSGKTTTIRPETALSLAQGLRMRDAMDICEVNEEGKLIAREHKGADHE